MSEAEGQVSQVEGSPKSTQNEGDCSGSIYLFNALSLIFGIIAIILLTQVDDMDRCGVGGTFVFLILSMVALAMPYLFGFILYIANKFK